MNDIEKELNSLPVYVVTEVNEIFQLEIHREKRNHALEWLIRYQSIENDGLFQEYDTSLIGAIDKIKQVLKERFQKEIDKLTKHPDIPV